MPLRQKPTTEDYELYRTDREDAYAPNPATDFAVGLTVESPSFPTTAPKPPQGRKSDSTPPILTGRERHRQVLDFIEHQNLHLTDFEDDYMKIGARYWQLIPPARTHSKVPFQVKDNLLKDFDAYDLRFMEELNALWTNARLLLKCVQDQLREGHTSTRTDQDPELNMLMMEARAAVGKIRIRLSGHDHEVSHMGFVQKHLCDRHHNARIELIHRGTPQYLVDDNCVAGWLISCDDVQRGLAAGLRLAQVLQQYLIPREHMDGPMLRVTDWERSRREFIEAPIEEASVEFQIGGDGRVDQYGPSQAREGQDSDVDRPRSWWEELCD